jgi:hypothetical protein
VSAVLEKTWGTQLSLVTDAVRPLLHRGAAHRLNQISRLNTTPAAHSLTASYCGSAFPHLTGINPIAEIPLKADTDSPSKRSMKFQGGVRRVRSRLAG